MYIEIGCFVTCVVGWILVCSTLPMEYWTFSEVSSTVLTTNHFHSNLWKDCTSDSTGMVDCKAFPTLISLQRKSAYFCSYSAYLAVYQMFFKHLIKHTNVIIQQAMYYMVEKKTWVWSGHCAGHSSSSTPDLPNNFFMELASFIGILSRRFWSSSGKLEHYSIT